jgi:hypothetical protein
MKPLKPQTFNDGVVNVYSVGNIADVGSMPKEGLTLKVGPLRYHERTVGMNRFWAAMQNQSRVDLVLRVPQRREVLTHDIAIPTDGKQYKIKQIQYPEDISPPVMDLSLERIE